MNSKCRFGAVQAGRHRASHQDLHWAVQLYWLPRSGSFSVANLHPRALARLFADLTGCECRLFVRLPYVVLGSLSSLLLFDLTSYAYGVVPAFWATAWYTVAPFFFFSASQFVVPDGPLDFFLLASAWVVAPILLGAEALQLWVTHGLDHTPSRRGPAGR